MITLEEDEPEIVEKMIEFLYTAQCSNYLENVVALDTKLPSTPDSPSPKSQLVLQSTKLYIIGDKYDISALKLYACNQFYTGLDVHWNMDIFVKCLELIYTQLPESDTGLKETALQFMNYGPRVDRLLEHSNFLEFNDKNGQVCADIFKGYRKYAKIEQDVRSSRAGDPDFQYPLLPCPEFERVTNCQFSTQYDGKWKIYRCQKVITHKIRV